MRFQLFSVTLIGSAATIMATAAHGAALTKSDTAPSSASITQSDFSAPAFDGAKDFTDNSGPPGQTFTPALNLTLNAITVKGFADTGASFGGAVNTGTWTITISRVDPNIANIVQVVSGINLSVAQLGAGSILTRIGQETLDPSVATDGDAYYTIALATPIALTGGTTYAYDIFSSNGYLGFAKSATDVYAGGIAMQHGTVSRTSADGAQIGNVQTGDRTFFINPAVPEPGSLALLGLATAAVAGRRRRS